MDDKSECSVQKFEGFSRPHSGGSIGGRTPLENFYTIEASRLVLRQRIPKKDGLFLATLVIG